MRREIEAYIRFVCDCLFPITCGVCGRDGFVVCPDCVQNISLFSQAKAIQNLDVQMYIDKVFVCTSYDLVPVQQLIKAAKYHGSTEAARFLGQLVCRWAGENVSVLSGSFDIRIVSIPLHPRRRRQRGYNQCDFIADALGECVGVLVDKKVLQRKRYTSQQAKLSQHERLQNVANAFTVSDRLDDLIIVLVDDVATTGATLDNAAQVLKTAGAREVWAIVVAKH